MTYSSIWKDFENVSVRQQWVDVGGIRTRFLASGPEGSPQTLIFLHGEGGHAEIYSRNLGPHGAHLNTIALDMLGHGWTQKTYEKIEISSYVEHLVRFLDVMGIERAHVSGAALGGWVAARFALVYPDRLRRLVLNCTSGSIRRPDGFSAPFQRATEDPRWEMVRATLEWSMANPASVTDDLVAIRKAIYSSAGSHSSLKNIMLGETDVEERNLLSAEEWHSIKAHSLVLWTTHNPLAPMQEGHRISRMISGSSLVVMENCGSSPQFEDPRTFNSVHLDFLTS